MDPREKTRQQHETEKPKDLREANENIRKSQGDDAVGSADPKNAGNKPAFDRDR